MRGDLFPRNPIVVALLCFVALAAAWLLSLRLEPGVIVTIHNFSGSDVTNVVLQFTGGTKTIPNLKTAQRLRAKIKPETESPLILEFTDTSKTAHHHQLDIEIEPRRRGAVSITLHPDGTVSWAEQLRP